MTGRPKKIIKPADRRVVAIAQFHPGAGPMQIKRKDPKKRRMEVRLEERRTRIEPEE